jgi:hypothetical protein
VSAADDDPRITVPFVRRSDVDIRLDGRLDEAIWHEIDGFDNLRVTKPDTLATPRFKTNMRFFNTERGMYIGVQMEQPAETLVARLSSRDVEINRDSWGITLDTSGEGLYGYWFVVNLGGSVRDGKVAPERVLSKEWDGPWQSATATLATGWGVELFLPWSMMSMPDDQGDRTMRFWVERQVAHIDEQWSWPALPETAPRFMSALGTLKAPGVEPRRQFEIFPNGSFTSDEIGDEDQWRAGFDLSWRPTPNLQVTATANPDFGVVESDDVVVNLTAFETFFPEKRLFFLEGREVFTTTPRSVVRTRDTGGVGSRPTTTTFNPEPTTLLNTRRIGGPPRTPIPDNVTVSGVERGKPTDLLGAVKVTGQTGRTRYGILAAFEDDVTLPGTIDSGPGAGNPIRVEGDGRDFGVVRFLYEDVGAARRSVGYLGTMVQYADYDAIVHGVDGHWLAPSGALQIDGQIIRSDVDDVTGNGVLTDISYRPRRGIEHTVTLDYLDDQLDVRDLGFIRRNDTMGIRYRYSYSTGRGLKNLRAKRRSITLAQNWNGEHQNIRTGYFFRNGWTFPDLSELRTELNYFPPRWEDRNSFGNGTFKIEDRFVAEIGYGTDTSRPLSWSGLAGVRLEDMGDLTVRTSFGFTYQPTDRFSIDLDISYLDRGGWLLHQEGPNLTTFEAQDLQPKLGVDVFLSANQQIRLSLQWAGIRAKEKDFYVIPPGGGELVKAAKPPGPPDDFAISRLTTQLRYRWQIGPLSDLFVVYTRGSNLPGRVDDEFGELFTDALTDPIVDLFVVKLRYRFGF